MFFGRCPKQFDHQTKQSKKFGYQIEQNLPNQAIAKFFIIPNMFLVAIID